MPAPPAPGPEFDARMLDLAARVALRGVGATGANPLVGCVLTGGHDGRTVIGSGAHERFGGPHAEAAALSDCRRRGNEPRGATAYVTLEPCNAPGRNPPCSEGLIAAGVARVVFARRDPNPAKAGGAERLIAAGIACGLSSASPRATRLSDPFVKRLTTALPWVVAKWAQSIDGRTATASGQSQWITSPQSRRRVHRLRAAADAIITGVGTVIADNPRLTARDAPPRLAGRRAPDRVVMDRSLRTPPHAAILRADQSPGGGAVFIAGHWSDARGAPAPPAAGLLAAGAGAIVLPQEDHAQPRAVLEYLAQARAAACVLIEAGPRVLGAFLRAGLVDECHVHIGPLLMGDPDAAPAAAVGPLPRLAAASRWTLIDAQTSGGDCRLIYRRDTGD